MRPPLALRPWLAFCARAVAPACATASRERGAAGLEAKPSSRWFNREATRFWFAEGALMDLYLAEHGY